MSTAVMVVPSIVIVPVTLDVRPTASCAPTVASVSWTRYPTNVPVSPEPIDGSTVHDPAMPAAVAAVAAGSSLAAGSVLGSAPTAVAVPVALGDAVTAGRDASDTGAGPAGRKNRYHRPAAPAMATARTTTPITTIAPRGLDGCAEVIGSAPRAGSMPSHATGPR